MYLKKKKLMIGIILVTFLLSFSLHLQAEEAVITESDLVHNATGDRYLNPISQEQASIRFEVRSDAVEEVILHIDAGEAKSFEMDEFLSYDGIKYYRSLVELEESDFDYYFEVKTADESFWYTKDGYQREEDVVVEEDKNIWQRFTALFSSEDMEVEVNPLDYDLAAQDIFTTPDWAKNAIFYQIFPDRFNKASSANDPEEIEIYQDVDQLHEAIIPDWEQGIAESDEPVLTEDLIIDGDNQIHREPGLFSWYGGDLKGVAEKVDYLDELGINAVYFNPIFKGTAYHRYNAKSFMDVDDRLVYKGDTEASNQFFEDLVEELNDKGIKVVIDAVWNHVGYEHWAFQDVVEHGADSEYADWFKIHSFPITPLYEQDENNPPNYEGWAGYGHLPELDVNNPEVIDYLYEATEKWMERGVDGWRLDVPNEVSDDNPSFWVEWREFVKDIDSESYITGEIWDNASFYLQGDEFDAVMNYPFRDAVIEFIGQGQGSADSFHNQMAELMLDYPEQAFYTLQNLVGSHDTTRFLTKADGDKSRHQLAAFTQMTYPGAPMIYYGDEIAMEGQDDPDNRRTMIWEDRGYTAPDDNMLEYFQEIIELRNQEPALRRGDIRRVETDNEMVYAFEREYQDEKLLVIINASDEVVDLTLKADYESGEYKDIYNDKTIDLGNDLRLEIEEVSGRVIRVD